MLEDWEGQPHFSYVQVRTQLREAYLVWLKMGRGARDGVREMTWVVGVIGSCGLVVAETVSSANWHGEE